MITTTLKSFCRSRGSLTGAVSLLTIPPQSSFGASKRRLKELRQRNSRLKMRMQVSPTNLPVATSTELMERDLEPLALDRDEYPAMKLEKLLTQMEIDAEVMKAIKKYMTLDENTELKDVHLLSPNLKFKIIVESALNCKVRLPNYDITGIKTGEQLSKLIYSHMKVVWNLIHRIDSVEQYILSSYPPENVHFESTTIPASLK